jgi:hypothetical protein
MEHPPVPILAPIFLEFSKKPHALLPSFKARLLINCAGQRRGRGYPASDPPTNSTSAAPMIGCIKPAVQFSEFFTKLLQNLIKSNRKPLDSIKENQGVMFFLVVPKVLPIYPSFYILINKSGNFKFFSSRRALLRDLGPNSPLLRPIS